MKNASAFLGTLILIISLFAPENAVAQQTLNNDLSIELERGRRFTGTGLTFARSINPYFAVLGKVSGGKWKTKISQLNDGKLVGGSSSIGLGTEWKPFGKTNGLYLQGMARMTKVKVKATGKIKKYINYSSTSIIVDVFSNIFYPTYDNFSYSNTQPSVSFSGKMGYRFMNKNEDTYFPPYIAMQSNPFKENNITLNSPTSDELFRVNPSELMKKGNVNFGVEMGVRF